MFQNPLIMGGEYVDRLSISSILSHPSMKLTNRAGIQYRHFSSIWSDNLCFRLKPVGCCSSFAAIFIPVGILRRLTGQGQAAQVVETNMTGQKVKCK